MKTKPEAKHTLTPLELPLRVFNRVAVDYSDVIDSEGTFVFAGLSRKQAEFIVRAVNSHEALLEAAKLGLSFLRSDYIGPNEKDLSGGAIMKISKIIAQAEGVK